MVSRMISILDLPVGTDDQHAFLQRVENVFEQPAFPREPLHKVGQINSIERVATPEHRSERGVFLDGQAKKKNKPTPRCTPSPPPKSQPTQPQQVLWAG